MQLGWVDVFDARSGDHRLGPLSPDATAALLSGEWGDPWGLGWKYVPPVRTKPKASQPVDDMEMDLNSGAVSPGAKLRRGVSPQVLAKKLRKKHSKI